MESERINLIVLVIGRRKSGKTEFVKGNEGLGLEGFINIAVSQGKKVLAVDTFDHPSYRDLKLIQPLDINLKWKKGVYRTFVNIEEMPDLLKHIRDNFYNGMLILEDAGKHQGQKLSKPLKALIGDSKQKNVDIVFMFHEWSFVPLDLLRYVDLIEIFKTNENPEVREGCFNVPMPEVLAMYERVKAHPSPYYHETLDNYAG